MFKVTVLDGETTLPATAQVLPQHGVVHSFFRYNWQGFSDKCMKLSRLFQHCVFYKPVNQIAWEMCLWETILLSSAEGYGRVTFFELPKQNSAVLCICVWSTMW